MIPIKIQCGCGQRYAFEIEPVGGLMPSMVACPVCGTDGTDAANLAIAQSVTAPPPPAPAAPTASTLRIHTAAHAHPVAAAAPAQTAPRRAAMRLPGQMDRTQAEHEARAKISWGDPPVEVVKFLMMQGFDRAEAAEMVGEMFKERASDIRRNGIRKIIVGSGLVCVPIIAFVVFMSLRFLPVKIFALTVMLGLWGAWMVLKGLFMVLAPKAESGDVSEM